MAAVAEAAAAELELHLPSHNTSTAEISPEFLRRHRPKHRDGRGGDADADDEDPLLYFCWQQQSCGSCLEASVACSWCPGSTTCVPNRAPFPLLAPLTTPAICPLAARERWELRAAPLGCNVSTLTFLTGVVSVLGTLVLVFVGWAVVVLGRKGWRAVGVRVGRRKRGVGRDGFRDYGSGRGRGPDRDRRTGRWDGREAERRLVFMVEEERRPLLV
ncbi:hypothetical protein GX51_05275 [Blastomyces parvus]|uniref:PSI domain-containing protein n=1 Tax=Blastomyces parvus TaxID=2060905 RepID=A0A2B7WPP0_9EURO|nr:hypothetical protein GX51_05275 [Blastomyces parvus]